MLTISNLKSQDAVKSKCSERFRYWSILEIRLGVLPASKIYPNIIQDQESWLSNDEPMVPNSCRETARFSSLVDQVEISIWRETTRGKMSVGKEEMKENVSKFG